ncbi:MAG TPA: Xaa-Pro peptidase family protein [Anaerolineales bacterium]
MPAPTNQLNITPIHSRQARLKEILRSEGLDSLILNAGPSLTYLTGLHFHLSERPVLVFFTPEMAPSIVLPELEKEKLTNLPYEIEAFRYGEDPSQWKKAFQQAVEARNLNGKRNGIEPQHLRFLEYSLLINSAPNAEFIAAGEAVTKLRMYKDASEINAMRKATQIAEQALNATLPTIKIGLSELDLATELTLQLFRAKSDPQMPFSPIVSSGPNSANPHATPSNRKLTPGDLLVIDWGASHTGYISDITRTFAIGKVEPELLRISKIVLEANAAGREIARPGIPMEAVDRAARSVIESAGYGQYFTHRTGHGIGMESHEEPYIRQGNSAPLAEGMVFTIEPGIYLPGRNGVRIEDDVVINDTGIECLTSLPREVFQLE